MPLLAESLGDVTDSVSVSGSANTAYGFGELYTANTNRFGFEAVALPCVTVLTRKWTFLVLRGLRGPWRLLVASVLMLLDGGPRLNDEGPRPPLPLDVNVELPPLLPFDDVAFPERGGRVWPFMCLVAQQDSIPCESLPHLEQFFPVLV